jgi:hypothetical protein
VAAIAKKAELLYYEVTVNGAERLNVLYITSDEGSYQRKQPLLRSKDRLK